MNNETDESVSFKSSPFENFDKEPELDFIDNVKSLIRFNINIVLGII